MAMKTAQAPLGLAVKGSSFRYLRRNYDLYLLLIPGIIYFLLFHYFPMYGLQLAFKDFTANLGIWNSPWVGFEHFERLFGSYYFKRLLLNTLGISLYQLLVGFPIPILLALMVNEVSNKTIKKTIQTVTYAPHFLSTVVLVGVVMTFLSPRSGVINHLIQALGGEPIYFMTRPEWFKSIYVVSDIWQNMGWNCIVYIAALAGISTELHEAAIVDGANRMQRIIHINLPGILPTVVTLLIMNLGRVMNVGFEKVLLMQNNLNLESADIISTYVYHMGIEGAQYSFSTAVGLFNSVINFVLLMMVNRISRKLSDTSLW